MTRRPPFAVAACLVLICSLRMQSAAEGETYTNPVIAEIGPADPCVVFFKNRYYLYATGDNRSYHVYRSSDLVRWTKGPKVFQPGGINIWAPDVFRDPDDSKFYLYYTANRKIGVAVAGRPDGKFVDRAMLFENAIDAHMFCDEKGILHGKATRGTPQPAPATRAANPPSRGEKAN